MDKVTTVIGQVPEKFSQKRRVPKLPLVLVALAVGIVGVYAIIHSFAASDPNLLFNGTQINQYVNQSAPGAVTTVPDPLGSGQTVFKMTVKNSDVAPITPTENPRAQLIGPDDIKNGDDVWLKTKFLLPNDFPASVPGWMSFISIYGAPYNGSSPWQISADGDAIHWQRNGTYGYDIPWTMGTIVRGQWVNILLHERFASDGFVEMWVNGQQVTFFANGRTDNPNGIAPTTRLNMQTMDKSNNGGLNAGKIAQYRQVNMFNTITTYNGPLILGKTQAAVDAADAANGGMSTTPPPPADTTAPTVSLTAPAAGATVSSSSVAVAASASDNVGISGVQFKLDGISLGAEDTTSPYATTWNTTSVSNGAHALTAVARDAAGNTKTSAAVTVTVNNVAPDTTPPNTAITVNPADPTTSTAASFSFTSTEANSSFACKLDSASYASCANPKTYSGLAVGTHTFTVRATDSAGNVDGSPATYTWDVDAAPDSTKPTVSFSAPANSATVSGVVTATASATDNTGVAKVDISLDNTLKMTDTAAPYNYSFDSKTLSNGSHTLTAKAYDAAGNSSNTATVTFTVQNADTTAPNAPANLAATAPNATTVNLSWAAATDTGANPTGVAKYNVLRDGVVVAQPATTSYVDANRTANTSYSYVVQAVDSAGNVSANSNTVTAKTPAVVTADTTPPSTPTGLTATTASSSQINLAWHASTDSGSSGLAGYNLYRGGIKINSKLVTGTSYGDTGLSASTAYSYAVEAVDGAGNKSPKTATVSAKTNAPPSSSSGSGRRHYHRYHRRDYESPAGATTSITGTPGGVDTNSSGTAGSSSTTSGTTATAPKPAPTSPVQITIFDTRNRPIDGAKVTLFGQTVRTDKGGVARFLNIASGGQILAVQYNGRLTSKNVTVKQAASTRTSQFFRVSVTRDKFNPALLAVPAVILAGAAILFLRPWDRNLATATVQKADTVQPVVSSSHPAHPDAPAGRNLESPGTVYSPNDNDKDQSPKA